MSAGRGGRGRSSVPAADDGPASPAPPQDAEPKRRRRLAWAAVTATVIVGLCVLAVAKLDLGEVARSLAGADPVIVALAALMMTVAFFARSESWFVVIRTVVPAVPVGRSAVRRALLIGIAGSTLAPARLGEAARVWIIARRLGNPRETVVKIAGTVLSQTLLNMLALSILTAIALSDPAATDTNTAGLAFAAAIPVGLAAALLAAPWILVRGPFRVLAPLRAIAQRIVPYLIEGRRGLVVFRHPRAALDAAGYQLFAWGLELGMCDAVIHALHLRPQSSIAAAAAVLVAVNLTAVIPVTPSNVGIFQAACIAVLRPFGVSASDALAYGILLQAVEVLCALALGVPALLREGLLLSDLRRSRFEGR